MADYHLRKDHRGLDERGFVLPMVLFAFVLMSAVAVTSMITSSDEFRAAQAVRESSYAFYAAEAGLNEVLATLPDSVLTSLTPGDSTDLGWASLTGGAEYRAVVHRWDTGGQPSYTLVVEGRDRSNQPGQRRLALSLTSAGDGNASLGECCDAPAVVRGETVLEERNDFIPKLSGRDTVPSGWSEECPDPTDVKPGIVTNDSANFLWDGKAILEGDPPMLEDTEMSDSTFNDFGGYTWQDVKDRADFVIGEYSAGHDINQAPPGDPLVSGPIDPDDGLPENSDEDWIGPRYNADGTCNTNHPLNWGSNDPSDPCFDYFPVILIRGSVEVHESMYGQGIFILDSESAGEGGEFELEGCGYGSWDGPTGGCTSVEMAGVIIGRGCVEVQYESYFYGSIFVDGTYEQERCGSDTPLGIDRHSTVQYSSCAVNRALTGSSLSDIAGGGETGTARLQSRSFVEYY